MAHGRPPLQMLVTDEVLYVLRVLVLLVAMLSVRLGALPAEVERILVGGGGLHFDVPGVDVLPHVEG